MSTITGYAGPVAVNLYYDRVEARGFALSRKVPSMPGFGGTLKQTTAAAVEFYVYAWNGSGKTGLVSADFTIKNLSKNGAAPAPITGTVTEIGGGWYTFTFTTAHTDTAGILTLSYGGPKLDTQGWAWRVTSAVESDLSTAVAAIQADTDDIQTRLPAALVSGRMSSYVGAADVTVVPTPASISALQADTDDIQTRLPAALDVSGNMKAQVKGMDTDTLTAAALKTDAVAEIQANLATSTDVATIEAAVAAVQADTDDIQTRLPTALDGSGFMKAQVKGMDANTVNASAVATDAIDSGAVAASAVTKIQAGLLTTADLGDMANQITRLEAVALGRWKVENNQLTLFDLDGTTPLVVFNLFDDHGNPSMTKIFERVPT